MVRQLFGWMDGWMDVWMDGWVDGWVCGWVGGWMNEWTAIFIRWMMVEIGRASCRERVSSPV